MKKAPWTSREVSLLKVRQTNKMQHEYTCGGCTKPLTPTLIGWVCTACGYTQNWCHDSDLEFDCKLDEDTLFMLKVISSITSIPEDEIILNSLKIFSKMINTPQDIMQEVMMLIDENQS